MEVSHVNQSSHAGRLSGTCDKLRETVSWHSRYLLGLRPIEFKRQCMWDGKPKVSEQTEKLMGTYVRHRIHYLHNRMAVRDAIEAYFT